MKVLLIDDDIEFLKKFRIDIDEFCQEIFDDYEIKELNTVDEFNGDLIFLDIDLNGFNSIETAGKLKNYNKNAIVIFVTSRENLVFNAFQVQPFYFIRKNQLSHDLSIALTLLRKHYLEKTAYTFIENGRRKSIDLNDIIYLECNDHMVTVFTTKTSYDFYKGLKEMISQDIFCEYQKIIQIHKKHCVNLMHVEDVRNDYIRLDTSQVLKIGRKYRNDFYKDYFAFMKG